MENEKKMLVETHKGPLHVAKFAMTNSIQRFSASPCASA